MAKFTIEINGKNPADLAGYIQEAVTYADGEKLTELLIAMRGKDGKSHNSTINKALGLKKFL